MNKILILDNPKMSVWAYPERKIVHHQMKAFCYGADFRDALTKSAEAMERYTATKYLSDNRAGGSVVLDDQEWAGTVWIPRVLAAGWKHWALVEPTNVIGQLHMRRAASLTMTQLGINTRVFTDAGEALKWLVDL